MSPELVVALILVLAVVLVALGLGLNRLSARRSRPSGHAAGPGDGGATATAPEPPAPPGPPTAGEPGSSPSAPTGTLPREPASAPPVRPDVPAGVVEPVAPARPRLADRLGKARAVLAGVLGGVRVRGVDDETWESLEETLLLADVGVRTSAEVLATVQARAAAERVGDGEGLVALLREELEACLSGRDRRLHRREGGLSVWLFVGVNGVGKTTTIAKVAAAERGEGHRVLLAAADTFRAAAADQLAAWAERVGVPVVRGQEGADPGSVVFDAIEAARTRDVDLVLVDTAGRLHTKVNLMAELAKLQRIVERTPGALQEVLLVIDATTGQNGLAQARQFAEAVGVTGVVLTKLDGTAKGGIVLAIEAELGIPVKLVGVGEGPGDLVPFDPAEFVAALVQ